MPDNLKRILAIGGLIILGLLLLVIVVRCQPVDHTAERQAEQTSKSGEAMSNAVANGIGTIDNRTVTEKDIDTATANVQKEIGNAQDPDAIHDAVVSGVCGNPAHRNDPACVVR